MSAEFEAMPMDARDEVHCPVCEAVVSGERCRQCGMYQGGTAPTSPFKGGWFWGYTGALAAVYAVTVGVVALAR